MIGRWLVRLRSDVYRLVWLSGLACWRNGERRMSVYVDVDKSVLFVCVASSLL